MIPGGISDPDSKCDDLRFWVALFALDCFVESFVCVWMGMAGYTDDAYFCVYWVLHLLVALPYVLCTITIPLAIYDDNGVACRNIAGYPLYPLVTSYWLHLSLFFVYVLHMLMVTYYSFLKAYFYPDLYAQDTNSKALPASGDIALANPAAVGVGVGVSTQQVVNGENVVLAPVDALGIEEETTDAAQRECCTPTPP